MIRGTPKQTRRIHRIGYAAVVLLCAALLFSVYLYRSELLAMLEPESGPENQEPLLPGKDPDDENPQLDVPEPEPAPPKPPSAKTDPFEPVDGDDLFALVTKQTTLERYAPADLEPIPGEMIHPDQRNWSYYLRREPLDQLKQMFAAALEDGVQLTVTSAYRSYDTQKALFASYAAKNGESMANTYSARAGQSEHQLGTTLDFNTDRTAGARQHEWLAQNAHRFGFAMSFPGGAEEITGFVEEPWHYRYIGVEAAAEWKEAGLPLCLFLEQKQ